MNRRSFLATTLGLLFAPKLAKLEALAPTEEAATLLFPTGTFVSAGGLCAPLTPIYELPAHLMAGKPVRDALPIFTAVRGENIAFVETFE